MDRMVISVGINGDAQHLLKDSFLNPFPSSTREIDRISNIVFNAPSQTFGIQLLGNLAKWNDTDLGYEPTLTQDNMKACLCDMHESGIGSYLSCMKKFYELEGEHNEEAIWYMRFSSYENAVAIEVEFINNLRLCGYKFRAI